MHFRPGWLSLGAIGTLGCVLFAASLVEGYIRHMPSGDQAGVALGLVFFLLWLLPAATVPILVSAEAREPTTDRLLQEAGRVPSWVSWLLLTSGWLQVGFAILYLATQVPRSLEAHILQVSSHTGLLLGFGGIWIGFGSAARRSNPAAPKWLAALLLITASATLILNANMLLEGFRGVAPGNDPWSLLARNLAFFCTPSLVLVVLLARSAWNLKGQGPRRSV